MKDFNVEEWDEKYPIYVEQSLNRHAFVYTERETFTPPNVKMEMTFTLPHQLNLVESVALTYYQFDKFMKQHYGETINAYQEMVRAKRIE